MSLKSDYFKTRGTLGTVSSSSSKIPSSLSISSTGRELAVGEETHTQEQCDIGVTKIRHQLTLLHVLASHILYSNISSIK